MNENQFAFSKINYILLIIGFAIVVLGFILMSGGSTTEEAFNPDIFGTRRIVIAPMVCLAGFLFVVVAILWRTHTKAEAESLQESEEVTKLKTQKIEKELEVTITKKK